MGGDDLGPVVAVAEPDHLVAQVGHGRVGPLVALAAFREVVVGAVDVDHCAGLVVGEVGPSAGLLEEDLAGTGQPVSALFEVFDELLLQAGVETEPLAVLGNHPATEQRGHHSGAGHEGAVEQAVVGLVVVRQQALVAGRLAGVGVVGVVGAGGRIEVAAAQGRGGDAMPQVGLAVVHQSAQHPGPALGRLVEQQHPAVAGARQRLGRQLA